MNRLLNTISKKQLKKVSDDGSLGREMVPLTDCNSIGIVYNAKKHSIEVEAFGNWLRENGVKVFTMGFVDEKELGHDFTPNYKKEYFCRKNLDRWRLPKKEAVNRFLLEKFDYMIGVFEDAEIPLMAISAQSKAKFRIGPDHPDFIHCFDMLLQVGDNELDDYIRTVKNYLTSYGK